MLRADNLSVRRGPCTVLSDIDLHLQPGQVLGVTERLGRLGQARQQQAVPALRAA